MSEEQLIAIVSFNGALKREVMRVKNELAKLDDLSAFRLDIEITGRVHDGDIKINFKLSNDTYGSEAVSGNAIDPIIEEFLRRHGWSKRHQPLMLTVGEQGKADADKPFGKDKDYDNSNL